MITTGFDARVKVQQIIENQLPEFLLSESPKAAEFLKQYYISQEYQGGPIDIAENLDQYLSLDNLTPEVVVGVTSLTTGITTTDSGIEISVNSTKGFPKSYGLFKVDDEIITYTGITTNKFTGCIRGFSGITSYRNQLNPEELIFSTSVAATHNTGASVHNLSAAFLKEFYRKIKYLLAPGFEDVEFVDDLKVNNFIKQARNFYEGKGTNDSFRILFNILYGVTPKVINLEDFLIKPSTADFVRRETLIVERISGNPNNLVGHTIRSLDNTAAGPVSEVEILTRGNKTFYKIQLFAGYSERSLIEGNFEITPKTIVSDTVSIGSSVISVDSTIGFPDSGNLVSGSNKITYTDKSVNQFFGCSGVVTEISTSSPIRSDKIIYGYENGDSSKLVELRITGVLSGIENEDDFSLLLENDQLISKNLGEKVFNNNKNYKEFFYNTWIYNTRSRYEIKSFLNNQITLYENVDKSSLKINDTVDILDKNSENIVLSDAKVVTISGSLVTLDKNIINVVSTRKLSIRRKYSYASIDPSSNISLRSSRVLSNIQNTYNENDEYAYIASNSLPDYQIVNKIFSSSININSSSILSDIYRGYNPFTNLYSILTFSDDVPFITGDAVVYTGNNTQISGLTFGTTYYVEVLKVGTRKNQIKLYNSRSFIATGNSVEFSQNGDIANHTFTLLQHFNKTLDPKKALSKLPIKQNIQSGTNQKTEVGPTGVMINGVEIINYKSNDKIYYGPIEKIRIYNGGSDYDVINPPQIVASNVGLGTTALIQSVVRGSVKEIIVDPQNFNVNRVLSATITGGNGTGAKLEPIVSKKYLEIEFNAAQAGIGATGGVDVTEETITFLERHNLIDGTKIVYNSNGNEPLGIGSFKFSNTNQNDYLINGAIYFPKVINPRSIYLYKKESDYLSGINTVGFTTINAGGTHKFRLYEESNVLSEIKVINSGSGYENRKLRVSPTGISTSSSIVTFNSHGFKNGDVINYTYQTSGISGLSTTNQYYVLKIDDSQFRLAEAGPINVSAATTNFVKQNFVKFKTSGEGYQIFSYPEIKININAEISGVGNTITATPIVRGEIIDAYLYENGTNYGSKILNFHKKPFLYIRNGEGAQLKPIIKAGKIINVEVQNGGKYYFAPPDLIVTGDGSSAKLRSVVRDGRIVDVIIINQGTNYTQTKTSVVIQSPGKNCVLDSSVRSLSVNNFSRFSDQIFVEYGSNVSYGIVGYSTDRDGTSFSDPSQVGGHSKVIGWAYDGNPIYGPFGFADPKNNNSSIVPLKTGYSAHISNISNRPIDDNFPLGFFVDDYKFDDSGDLDIHNGRFSKTPEFPNGIYAYFVGVSTDTTTSKLIPKFPYFIGDTYRSVPTVNNLNQSFNFNSSKLVRNTFPYRVNQENSKNDFITESNKDITQVTLVESVSKGSIDSLSIVNPGNDYRVGNSIIFDNQGTDGGGAIAEVSEISGKSITEIQTSYDSFENSVVTWQDQNTIRIYTNQYHSFADQDLIQISGISTFIDKLTNTQIIGVSSDRSTLIDHIPPNVGLVTDIYVSSISSLAGSGTTIGIGTEVLSVLNIFPEDNILRVKRGSTGTAHSISDAVDYYADSFTISLRSNYFDSSKNYKTFFNPRYSVGVGIQTGQSTSINYYVGASPKTISVQTQSIYIPNHDFKHNERVLLTKSNSSSAFSVSNTSGGSNFNLPISGNTEYVYVIKKSKDFIGLTTQVGIASEGLFFVTNGSDDYNYQLETLRSQITATSKRIKTKVSVSTSHNLQNGDLIKLNINPKLSVGIGNSTSVVVKYDSDSNKLLVNPVGFTSYRVNSSSGQIYLPNHGYKTGDKIFYRSSDATIGGITTGGYYIFRVDDNNIKLSETYFDSTSNPAITISIGNTGGSGHEISLLNPQISVIKNNNLVFNVSDSSLIGYKFKLYYDNNFSNEFVSVGSTSTFSVVSNETIGISSSATITINYDDLLPTKLYYCLEKNGLKIHPDDDVKDYSEILYKDSLYSGKYKVFGVGTTDFYITLNEVPEKLSYSPNQLSRVDYSTTSLSSSGPISKLNIISGGSNYSRLPLITGLSTSNSNSLGSNAIIKAKTKTIGNLNEFRIVNEGFDYSSDNTLRPQVDIPKYIGLESSEKITKIDVLSGGKNYTSEPNLVVVNEYTNTKVNSGFIKANYRGNTIISVDIIEEPRGLSNVDHRIYAVNNSNGIQVNRVLSYSAATGIVQCELSTPPIDGFVNPPFEIGDLIFVEGIKKQSFTDALGNITSPGTGFNSADNGYNFFKVTNYVNSNPAILEYYIGEFTSNAGTPVTNQTDFTSIVKSQNYPTFNVTKSPSLFYLSEKLFVNNVITDLEVVFSDRKFIKVVGDYEIKIGDILKGSKSGNFATINDVLISKNRFTTNYANKKSLGWDNQIGQLNYDLQVLPDNNYYQNLSYTLKSPITFEKFIDPVNKLVHPSGMKNFGDVDIQQSAIVSVGATQSLVPILDFISENRVDTINNFDLVLDYDPTSSYSRNILFKTKRLADFVECRTNRVLQIDDISGKFSSSEFNRLTFEDTIEYPVTDFYSRVLVQVTDEDKQSTQLSEIITLNNYSNTYNLNKVDLFTETKLGDFSGDFATTGDVVLRFTPIDPNTKNYNLKIYRQKFDSDPYTVGIAHTDIGFTRLSSRTENVGPASGTGLLGVSTTVFESQVNQYDTLYAYAHITDTQTNEQNYFEIAAYYDGIDTHISEYYFDTKNFSSGLSAGFIGTFGLNVSNNILNLTYKNVNSDNNIRVKVKTVGIGSTAIGIGTYRYLVANQIQGTERTAKLESDYIITSGITTTIKSYNSVLGASSKLLVKVGIGSTVAIHNLYVVADQSRVNIQQSPFLNVRNGAGIGTFSAEFSGSNINVKFHPDSQYSGSNIVIQSYTEFIYFDTDEFNVPGSYDYGSSSESLSNSFYGSLNEFGKDRLDFDLTYKGIPIFEKTFSPADSTKLNLSTGVFTINDHFFETGEKLLYTPASTLTGIPATSVGIGTTIVSGISFTGDIIVGFSSITGIAASTGISVGHQVIGKFVPDSTTITGIMTNYTFFVGDVVSGGSSIITGVANTSVMRVGSGIYSGNNTSLGTIYSIGINSITASQTISAGAARTYYSTDSNWTINLSNVSTGTTFRQIYSTGISTNICPSDVYAIRLSKDSFKITGTAGNNGVGFTFTSVGSGNLHKLSMSKRLEKSLITVDGVNQYPIMFTPLNYTLQNNGGNIGVGATFMSLSGISSIKPRDILKIRDEFLNIRNVGFGTTSLGPITGIGSVAIVEVSRGFVGSSATVLSDGDLVRLYRGAYNIVGNKIYFTEAPDGRGNNNRLNSSALGLPKSSFNGRVYLRKDYTLNKIYDDISDSFTGLGRTFTVYKDGQNITGLEAGSNLVFINDVFQTPDTSNNAGNNYTFLENTTVGISSISFTGINRPTPPFDKLIVDSDINQNQLPRGGVVIAVAATGGLGYAPLVGASVTATLNGSGTIVSVGIGTSGTFGSGYNGNVSVGVTDSTGNGANIQAIVGAGGTLSFNIISGGSGYTNPVFEINDPVYQDLPVIGVSRLGVGNTTIVGVGISMTFETAPSLGVGIGSTLFRISSYEFSKRGYAYQIGDVFKPVGLITAFGLTSPLEELIFTVTEVFNDSFASWQLGEFDYIDSIKELQNGSRTRFPLYKNGSLLSFQKNLGSVESLLIDFDSILLIYVNGVMQEPGISYIFNGGTTFSFTQAPRYEDKVDIFFYRGTRNVDSLEIDVNENIKPGDTLKINKNDQTPSTVGQTERIVSEILSADIVETGIYLGDGIDSTNYKPVDWLKQKRDIIIDNNPEYKFRDSIEGMVFPTSKIIKNFGSSDTEIFVDDALFFNYEENESAIEISKFSGILIPSGNDPVSAAFTAVVSSSGTISSVTILDGGSGYTPNSTLALKLTPPIGGIGTVFKAEVKNRPGILGVGSERIIGINTSSIKVGQTVKAIQDVFDTTFAVIGISSGNGGSVILNKSAANTASLTRTFNFGKYQEQSRATATASVSPTGVVTTTNVTLSGAGYTSTSSPLVISSLPDISYELIKDIQFVQGFSGIITGISTNTGTSGNPLALTFYFSYDSGVQITDLEVGYPIYVSGTTVGHGLTSINTSNTDVVGIGTTFVDNIYYVNSISIGSLVGIITANILSTTNTSGIHTMPNSFCGRFSWGKLSGFTRSNSPVSIAVTGFTINTGLTTFPTLQRREYGLRESGALRKDLA